MIRTPPTRKATNWTKEGENRNAPDPFAKRVAWRQPLIWGGGEPLAEVHRTTSSPGMTRVFWHREV